VSGPAAASAAHIETPNRGIITFFLAVATTLVTLDSTIANVALPHVMGSISASGDQITWVLTSYIIATAMALPLTGWLDGRFGRKTVLLAAVGGFTVTSMLCGVSSSLPEIVLYRLLQGMFGAPLMPLTQAQLLDMNPPERHGRAMGIFGLGSLIGPIIGPTLGGYLTDSFSWRWIFYVNVPVGAAAFIGLLLLMPSTSRGVRRRLDFFGYAALVVFLAGMQLVLDRGAGKDWFASREVIAEAVVAAAALWVFVLHSATAEHPFFDPRLLRDQNYLAMAVMGLFSFMLLATSSALLPSMLQQLLGYPAQASGMLLIPRGVGATIATVSAGRLMGRIDVRLLVLTGICGCAFALAQMQHFDLSMDRRPVLFSGFCQGLSFGMIMVPITTFAFATLPIGLRAEAAGLSSVLRNLGGSMGIASMEAVLTHQTQTVHAALAEHVIPSDPVVGTGLAHALLSPATTVGALSLDAQIGRQAAMVAYIDVFRLMFLICIAIAPLLLIVRTPSRARQTRARPA
jgi:DHA2 family multidrug resistance protein